VGLLKDAGAILAARFRIEEQKPAVAAAIAAGDPKRTVATCGYAFKRARITS
jgi:hypothetical protein